MLDAPGGIERLGGDEAFYWSILEEFIETEADSAERIRRDLARGALEAAADVAHSVKGIAGNISAQRLYRVANELETVLRQKGAVGPEQADDRAARAQQDLQCFARALEDVLAEIERQNPGVAYGGG